MATYDVESIFTNIPLNEAINICLWRHLMLIHYSPTTLLMMLLIFVYDDIWCWVIIPQHPILMKLLPLFMTTYDLSHYSPTSLLMMRYLFMTTYDIESLFTNIPLNDVINICLFRHMMWSHYSTTSSLMKLLTFAYGDIWSWVIIHQHPT